MVGFGSIMATGDKEEGGIRCRRLGNSSINRERRDLKRNSKRKISLMVDHAHLHLIGGFEQPIARDRCTDLGVMVIMALSCWWRCG